MKVMLEPYRGRRSRYRCPQCGRLGKFARYIFENGDYISDEVGRCDRENSCGYHKKPKDYFLEKPNKGKGVNYYQSRSCYKEAEKPVQFLSTELMSQTLRVYEQNNFFLFLASLIDRERVIGQMKKYNVGTSKHWKGANIFWQVDIDGRVRQLKLMLYDPMSGKRIKSDGLAMKWDTITQTYYEDIGGNDKSIIYGKFIQGGKFKNLNLRQCLFGEHLLSKDGPVAIVESEKTAIIADYYYPQFIWIATGGSNGAGFTKPEVCRVLRDRDIILFPDLGQTDKWREKAKKIQRIIPCRVVVSDLLEEKAGPEERSKGWDLADYLIDLTQSPKVVNIPEVKKVCNGWEGLDEFEGF